MGVPVDGTGQPVVPAEVWVTWSPAVQAVICALAQQVVALTARVQDLEARLGQNSSNSSNSSRPPSSDPPHRKPKRPPPSGPSGRRAGGQPGHVAHHRALVPPARVDQVHDHWPATCGLCQQPLVRPAEDALLAPATGYRPHQVTELPSVRAQVTEHRLHRLACSACRHRTRAVLPADVPSGAFGPRVQATVALLSGRYRLSRREVADLCGTLLDVPLCVGSVDALCQATATALAAPVAEATTTLSQADVVHADETSWRQAGQSRWLWAAATALVTVFTIATSRGSGVVKGWLGDHFVGTLVSDRWSAYSLLDVAFRQVCWAHLRRDFQALVDRGGAAAPVGMCALTLSITLFHHWHQFQAGALDRAGLQVAVRPVQDAFTQLVDEGSVCPDRNAAGLCRALDRLWPALWTFLDEEGVPPTNNRAEQALRPGVLWRKGSLGTQSDDGARFVERLLTVTATCKQQGRSVLSYLTAVCTAAQQDQPVPSLLPVAA
jgi:transposase